MPPKKSKKFCRTCPYTKWERDRLGPLPRKVIRELTFCLGSEEEKGYQQN